VCLGIVPDVVERDIGGNGPGATATDDVDLGEPCERRQQQRRVVGDAGTLRR
jgi:hypothetical protein